VRFGTQSQAEKSASVKNQCKKVEIGLLSFRGFTLTQVNWINMSDGMCHEQDQGKGGRMTSEEDN
jgi:hypothetical protein